MAVDKLARIVLVHGAAHGAWCWEALVPLLERRGYAVSTLDLPGLGSDLTPQKDVTLAKYIDRVVETVEAGPAPVLLVGHSMGGMPISGAAEAIPDRIGKLIYLAAILPVDGEMMLDGTMSSENSALRAMRPSEIEGAHGFDPIIAAEVFYNLCAPEIAARAAERLRPQATGPLHDRIKLTPERWGRLPKTYIVCSKDRALPPDRQRFYCDRATDVTQRVMATDHSPFFSDPEGLAEILDAEASSTVPSPRR